MKLSKKLISELSTDDKDLVVWDDSLPGFGVRIKASGAKTYILQYRNRFGSSRRLSIAKAGDLTLDQARKEAVRLKGAIALGEDPAAERATLRSSISLRDLAEKYLRLHCEGRCKDSTMRAHTWLLNKFILPRIGARKVVELSPSDIGHFHQSLSQTPYNANRVLGLLKAIFNKAEEWGDIPQRSNPAAPIRPFRERKRQRFLSPEEFRNLFQTIDKMALEGSITPHQAGAIGLLAVTGCRLSEILTLKWSQVDIRQRRIILEDHKTERLGAKTIHLNDAALHILERIPVSEGNPHVIVGGVEGHHLVNLQKSWRQIRSRAGLDDLRIHDLRHSFASAAASAGIPLHVIGALLGHASVQSTARYAHLTRTPIVDASQLIGTIIVQKEGTE